MENGKFFDFGKIRKFLNFKFLKSYLLNYGKIN